MNDASSTGPSTNPPEASRSNDHEASTTAGGLQPPVEQQRKSVREVQKMAFLDHLIRNLDIIIYCELSILYYMDCSLLQFLLRALPHWFFFTPKPDILPPPRLLYRGPYVGAIFGSNLICMLSHILFSSPAAGEATRGYLHGGMIIDFVGQASPVSRWRLVGLDTLCLVLQVVMMCLTMEKQRVQGWRKSSGPISGSAVDAAAEPRSGQDLDAEERGVLGSEQAGGIEMQELGPGSQGRTGGDEDRERDELFAHELQEEERDDHPLDVFYNGDFVLVKLHLLDTLRTQWRTSNVSASSANVAVRTAGMQTAAGELVGRRIAFTWGGRTTGGGRIA